MTKEALVSFHMGGHEYSFAMPAEDWSDAERRLVAIRSTATVIGCPVYSVRANALTLPFAHAFAVAWTWVRNALR